MVINMRETTNIPSSPGETESSSLKGTDCPNLPLPPITPPAPVPTPLPLSPCMTADILGDPFRVTRSRSMLYSPGPGTELEAIKDAFLFVCDLKQGWVRTCPFLSMLACGRIKSSYAPGAGVSSAPPCVSSGFRAQRKEEVGRGPMTGFVVGGGVMSLRRLYCPGPGTAFSGSDANPQSCLFC